MLKKSTSFVLDVREAYLVKRRSFLDSDVSRFTFHERRGRTSSAACFLYRLCAEQEQLTGHVRMD